MIKVYFDNNEYKTFIGQAENEDEAYSLMYKDLEKKGIVPSYYRGIFFEDVITIDYGSHINFYEFHLNKKTWGESDCKE